MEDRLPADRLAQEMLLILSQGDITVSALAVTIRVHPDWLRKLLVGEIAELDLLTVVGICRELRVMPEDIWDAAQAAHAFREFTADAFRDPPEPDPDE